jgi:hypothetical protein
MVYNGKKEKWQKVVQNSKKVYRWRLKKTFHSERVEKN